MKLDWYKQEASRTCHNIGDVTITNYPYDKEFHRLHMISGIITEFGEVMDVFKKKLLYGKVQWDNLSWQEKLTVEYGDWGWYCINWIESFDGIITEDDDLLLETDEKIVDTLNDYLCVITSNPVSALQAWIDLGYMMGINHDKAMELNIGKLRERFPSKFDADLAKNKNEKNELEGLRRKAN